MVGEMKDFFDDFDTQIQSDELASTDPTFIFIDEDMTEEDYLQMYNDMRYGDVVELANTLPSQGRD